MIELSGRPTYEDASVKIDFSQHQVWADGSEVTLQPLQFGLLAALVEEPGRTLSWRALGDRVWPNPPYSPVAVKRQVSYLRLAIGWERVQTIYKFGYRYIGHKE